MLTFVVGVAFAVVAYVRHPEVRRLIATVVAAILATIGIVLALTFI